VTLPPAGAGGFFFSYKRKKSLSTSGCHYISRQESGVLCSLIKEEANDYKKSAFFNVSLKIKADCC